FVFHISTLLLFCSSMLCHHPRSTLFPYTTLFRSKCAPFLHILKKGDAIVSLQMQLLHCYLLFKPSIEVVTLSVMKRQTILLSTQDRKSTRLNSSHQIISYAVFCLKKKKNKQ